MRPTPQSRFRSRLYLFNSFGMLGLYVVVVVVNFVFRIAEIRDGICIIGMKSAAMIPLISFDAVVNVYLTGLFLVPLTRLYTFRHSSTTTTRSQANIRLRKAALRTFCGAVFTLVSSIVNLSVLMALDATSPPTDQTTSTTPCRPRSNNNNNRLAISSTPIPTPPPPPPPLLPPSTTSQHKSSLPPQVHHSSNSPPSPECLASSSSTRAVVVTTTIRHESRPLNGHRLRRRPPSSDMDDDDDDDDDDDNACDGPRTTIVAGDHLREGNSFSML
ncbi:hypothetical protein CP533_4272 [Ophiocordyceps camponoti-saundersi (nom. inval.)]|nr:hypothetical protein CP533_4272 [Ophiocordyceps camponoti-saundersi (nom. inval.)]